MAVIRPAKVIIENPDFAMDEIPLIRLDRTEKKEQTQAGPANRASFEAIRDVTPSARLVTAEIITPIPPDMALNRVLLSPESRSA